MKQEQFLNVIDRDEAERRFSAAVNLEPLGDEIISLADALGRVLAQDVISRVDVPSFDRSNYDGFALRAADTYGAQEEVPRPLRLLDETIVTSVVPRSEVASGTAVPIATGAMLPRGADAVVMIEDTDMEDETLHVQRAITPGFGVTFAGTDISEGEIVLRRGDVLTSRETGVLAAVGNDSACVFRRPKVGILSTGDEIVPPGRPIRPGEVYDSNARILADAVRELGAVPEILGIVQDDAPQMRSILQSALDRCDVVLLSGGTSKGAGDISYRIVKELTDPGIVAHGVALKPGKPICLASHHGKPVAVLPGFPTSAIFTFHEFLAPVIRRLGGMDPRETTGVMARMAVRVNSQIGRKEYLLVGLVHAASHGDDAVSLAAYPMGKGSGSVTSFSRADGFVSIDRHQEIVEEDTLVAVTLLAPDSRPADLVVIGSHCVGLDYLLSELQRRGWHTKFLAVGSTGGLAAVRRGECDLAGIHLLDPQTGQYNTPFLTRHEERIPGYRRMQGIVFRAGDERFEGQSVPSAVQRAIEDPRCVMVNRNQGSGTRILIDRLLGGAQPAGYALQARNHNAVAAAVLQGRADWGVAIERVARHDQLSFLEVTEEQYDFVVSEARADMPAVKAFRDLLSEPDAQSQLHRLGCRR